MNTLKAPSPATLSLAAILVLAGCASSRVASSDDGSIATTSPIVGDAPLEATPAPATGTASETPGPVTGGTLTLNVAGLSCPQCASNIDHTVKRVRGVSSVEVDLGAGLVHVSMLPGQTASRAQIERAVRDAGFEVVD